MASVSMSLTQSEEEPASAVTRDGSLCHEGLFFSAPVSDRSGDVAESPGVGLPGDSPLVFSPRLLDGRIFRVWPDTCVKEVSKTPTPTTREASGVPGAFVQPWQRPCVTAVMWGQERTTSHGDRSLAGRRGCRSSSSCTRRRSAGRGQLVEPVPLERVQRHSVEQMGVCAPSLLVLAAPGP